MQAMLTECVPLQAAQAMSEQPDQAAQEVLQQLEQLERQLAGLVESIIPELQLASKQAIWTGASMFVAAAFANEEALWLALCLQVSSCFLPCATHWTPRRNLTQVAAYAGDHAVYTRQAAFPSAHTGLLQMMCSTVVHNDSLGLCRCGPSPGMQRKGRKEQTLALLQAQICHQAWRSSVLPLSMVSRCVLCHLGTQ